MNKLCCILDPYLTCKWCEGKLCLGCAKRPLVNRTCTKSAYAANRHTFVGKRIIRSMPLRFPKVRVHPDEFYPST